jgi:hypothetical protein
VTPDAIAWDVSYVLSCRPECGPLACGLTQTLVSVARLTVALAGGRLAVMLCRTDSPAVSRSFRDLTYGAALAIASAGACGVSRSPMAGSCPVLPPAWQAQHGGDGSRAADSLCFSLRTTLRWW